MLTSHSASSATPNNESIDLFNLAHSPQYNCYAKLAACAYPQTSEFHRYSPPEGFTFVEDFDDLKDAGFTAQIYVHISGIKVLAIAGTEGGTREKDDPLQNLLTIMKDVFADVDFMMQRNMAQVESGMDVMTSQDNQASQIQSRINTIVDKCNIAVSNSVSQTSKKISNCAERIVGDSSIFADQLKNKANRKIDVIVGHSLGGIVGKIIAYKIMLKEYTQSSFFHTPQHKRRKLACITFNSPDVSQYIGITRESASHLQQLRVENICHPWDMIAAARSNSTLGQMRIGDSFPIIMNQLGHNGRLMDGKTHIIPEGVIRSTVIDDGDKMIDLYIINTIRSLAEEVEINIEKNANSFWGSDNSGLNMYGLCQVLDLKLKSIRDFPPVVIPYLNKNHLLACASTKSQRVNFENVIEILKLKFDLCHGMAAMKVLVDAYTAKLSHNIPEMHQPGFTI